MEKKIYQKPTIKVVPVNIRSQILTTSGDDQWLNYAPGMDDNKNLMA